jgi:hypothetical protein
MVPIAYMPSPIPRHKEERGVAAALSVILDCGRLRRQALVVVGHTWKHRRAFQPNGIEGRGIKAQICSRQMESIDNSSRRAYDSTVIPF